MMSHLLKGWRARQADPATPVHPAPTTSQPPRRADNDGAETASASRKIPLGGRRPTQGYLRDVTRFSATMFFCAFRLPETNRPVALQHSGAVCPLSSPGGDGDPSSVPRLSSVICRCSIPALGDSMLPIAGGAQLESGDLKNTPPIGRRFRGLVSGGFPDLYSSHC